MASSSSRIRLLLGAIAAAVPLVPIAIGLSLSGASPSPARPASPSTAALAPVPAPASSNPSPVAARAGSLVASLRRPTALRRSPGTGSYGRLERLTPFGSPQTMLVVRSSGRWLGVLNPVAGNGRVGWIPASDVTLSRVQWHLDVSLSRRQLTVRDRGQVVRRYRVAIGAPASPTPTGRFAVTDELRTGDPAGPYGCCVLALSAVSPHAIQGWSGGNRIAIHSTPDTPSIGLPVSHGCLRLTLAEGQWLLRHIPRGTPAVIRT